MEFKGFEKVKSDYLEKIEKTIFGPMLDKFSSLSHFEIIKTMVMDTAAMAFSDGYDIGYIEGEKKEDG